MASAGAPDHVVHVEFPGPTAVQRVDAVLKISAQSANLQDMLQQLSPDLFLIFGERGNLIQGFSKYLNHKCILSEPGPAVKPAASWVVSQFEFSGTNSICLSAKFIGVTRPYA